jgi:hypothetical protein
VVNDLSAIIMSTTLLQAPRVEVLFRDAASEVATVTLWRTSDGRTTEVSGGIRRTISGALSVVDYDVPFNRIIQYQAQMFAESGAEIGYSSAAVLGEVETGGLLPGDDLLPGEDTLPEAGDIGYGVVSADTWMHNPLDPEGAVRVTLRPSAGRRVSRPVPGGVVRPKGRRVGVMVSERRRGVEGINFDVYCTDESSADKVQAFLGTDDDDDDGTIPVVCVRLGSRHKMRIPQPFYLGVVDIVEDDLSRFYPEGVHRSMQYITGDESARPAPGLFIPLLTRADANAFYASRAAANSDHPSRLSLNRFYEIAGYAD